ncbi:NAD-dependent succinate-semialdehyde dehydrogenase [Sporosarcina pasteurii]|uniref:Succinate-semialdehyde dehydrogenase [NADP(+)] GabD n=1 Tax=Sporosarcina pasteurii TaxID=1474 RepID=A0A380C204_SPOPA|nr:NAD-dependent succinate-semialdehyde dehydrogenase [Sporosarcina pasteurii]MDS9471464.1 NAD-dependent succinate-semialdehyde dehydrogenase [Sporosarcina pasteurii]QBQ04914.1 NAD-dependent succinate-semialdehyde dehydrogenase [Sporosarcina pasteurii]SUJ10354.1 Succinate-semialdehyde dehydrogenase [NADP(+)] GabD [Sporosarcina pasteurii]
MNVELKTKQSRIYINGEWVGEDLGELQVLNPANSKVVGSVPNGGEKETNEAIEAAHEAFKTWSKTTAYERAGYLEKLHALMLENQEELAQIMTLEMGKPIQESRGEVLSAASYLEWFAEEGKRVYGETIPTHAAGKRLQVWKKPVGVVAAITPWNFPVAMLTRKLGPALAAGCTIVIKPSGESPLSAVKLVELCEKAGIPRGVVNLVTGSSSKIGNAIMENEKVRKVTFTGSTGVGKMLIEQSAKQVKRLSLELGGHAPFIILDDANLDAAVEGVVASAFRNAGQTCICTNRIYVQSGVHDAFVEKFAAAVEALKVGNGIDETVQIGPVINQASLEKVAHHVEDALSKGAALVTGGSPVEDSKGTFYTPTVLANVSPEMVVMNEETFGPLAPIQKIETVEEAIKLANDTSYGLAAYVFTDSVSTGTKLVEELEYGIVGWNDGTPTATQAPFGGMKESGMGREGGRQGIEDYLETQFVSIGVN